MDGSADGLPPVQNRLPADALTIDSGRSRQRLMGALAREPFSPYRACVLRDDRRPSARDPYPLGHLAGARRRTTRFTRRAASPRCSDALASRKELGRPAVARPASLLLDLRRRRAASSSCSCTSSCSSSDSRWRWRLHAALAAQPDVAVIGVVALFVALPNSVARTQSFAYVLFVALFWLLATDSRTPSRRILLALPLLVLWANVHGSAVLGASLVALWAVAWIDSAGSGRRPRGLACAPIVPRASRSRRSCASSSPRTASMSSATTGVPSEPALSGTS